MDWFFKQIPIDPAALSDGVHSIEFKATQSDGLSASYAATFSTDAHQIALQNQANTTTDLLYVMAAVAAAALVISFLALRMGRAKTQTSPVPPQV